MNTLEIRDKLRHFFAVNQINIKEFKHLIGTVFLFISIGGLHKLLIEKIHIKKYKIYEITYYIMLAIIGVLLYLKIA
jgi:uncharacterized membrane protein YraQ (UPF0718 family)